MPSFSAALTPEQVDDLVAYLRSFCKDSRWPRGELNLPRALVTEKAYPEDEVVLSTSFNAQGAPGGTSHIIHEQRFGKNNQIEVDVPVNFQDENHTWYGGVGDTTLGCKANVLFELAVGIDFRVAGWRPFADRQPNARFRHRGRRPLKLLRRLISFFRRIHLSRRNSARICRVTPTLLRNRYFSTRRSARVLPLTTGLDGFGSPMMEFVAARDLVDNAKTNWDVVPQMQVTISKRQHIKADLGVRVPINNTTGRNVQIVFYLLWDWQDGRLNEGWR